MDPRAVAANALAHLPPLSSYTDGQFLDRIANHKLLNASVDDYLVVIFNQSDQSACMDCAQVCGRTFTLVYFLNLIIVHL